MTLTNRSSEALYTLTNPLVQHLSVKKASRNHGLLNQVSIFGLVYLVGL